VGRFMLKTSRDDIARQYLEIIRRESERRRETDYTMPLWLPFVPAILSLVAAILAIAGHTFVVVETSRYTTFLQGGVNTVASNTGNVLAFTVFIILLAAAALNIYVVYKWIDRRNTHFKRILRMFETVVSYLDARGVSDPEMGTLRSLIYEMRMQEESRSPVLWIVLSLVFNIVYIYVLHFLTKDFYEHEQRERSFLETLSHILQKRGIYIEEPQSVIPHRSTVVYVVFSVLTLGVFLLYWIYVVTRDPNEHFAEHERLEPMLIEALAKL